MLIDVFDVKRPETYAIFTEPRDDTTCFSSDSDLTSTVEMGHLAFVLSLTFLTLNV